MYEDWLRNAQAHLLRSKLLHYAHGLRTGDFIVFINKDNYIQLLQSCLKSYTQNMLDNIKDLKKRRNIVCGSIICHLEFDKEAISDGLRSENGQYG